VVVVGTGVIGPGLAETPGCPGRPGGGSGVDLDVGGSPTPEALTGAVTGAVGVVVAFVLCFDPCELGLRRE
jgi:hypothetical protein